MIELFSKKIMLSAQSDKGQADQNARGPQSSQGAHSQQSSHGARSSQSGFTLIEFIIAIAVMALIISAIIPSFTNYRQRIQEVERATNEDVIRKALRQCYALEGRYPPVQGDTGLDYLAVNYGIILKPDVYKYEYSIVEGVPNLKIELKNN